MTVQPFAYAWRWKGGATWKLTLTKKPNHHPDIEIKDLFESRASQAAPAPVAYRVRFAGEGAGDWAMASPESAVHYIGRDGYECQPLYAAPAPSDGLREENERLQGVLATIVSRCDTAKQQCSEGAPVSAFNLACGILGQIGADRAALSASPAQEGDRT